LNDRHRVESQANDGEDHTPDYEKDGEYQHRLALDQESLVDSPILLLEFFSVKDLLVRSIEYEDSYGHYCDDSSDEEGVVIVELISPVVRTPISVLDV